VQNPAAGQERLFSERLLVRASEPRSVVVIGGGPAGLKVAEIAARRGHRVSVFERAEHLGGQVRLAARQPHHEEFAEVTHFLEAAVRRLGVEVWTGVDADAESVLDLDPDVVIVATGSQPNLPSTHRQSSTDPDAGTIARRLGLTIGLDVEGLDLDIVMSTDEVLSGVTVPGHHVVVADGQGHWEAAGTAEFLADAGYHVTVVTPRPSIGSELEGTNHAMFMQRVGVKGIEMKPLTHLRRVEPGRVLLVDAVTGNESWLRTDAVVPVYWRRSRDDVYHRLRQIVTETGRDVRVERVGDAAAARVVQSILLEAFQLASEL
jgi:hypothetical protein